MRIGSLLKNSLIDWDGKLTAVIFTKGCNFRCGFCHNPSLVLPELLNQTRDYPENRIFSFLKNRRSWLDGVVVTGGEPTIYDDLPEFIAGIKALGFKLKLDTNGTNPKMLEKLIEEKLVDFVAMDVKTILTAEEYEKITNCKMSDLIKKIEDSISILRVSHIQYQFRTTVIPKYHSCEKIAALKKMFGDENYIIQQFRQGDLVENYT